MDNKLTNKQLELLLILYKFRFVTVELAATVLEVKSANSLRERYAKLVKEGYVGRRYDASYRIKSRHAEYFLLSKGITALKKQPTCDDAMLHRMYKDKTASNLFVGQNLAVAAAYCRLRNPETKFLTQSQLAGFVGFPNPLPDGFMSIRSKQGSCYFFVEVMREAEPFFVALHRRAKRYIAYSESGDWQIAQKGKPFPAVLLICETPALQKRLAKRIAKLTEASWSDELNYYTATAAALGTATLDSKIWSVVGGEAVKQVSLHEVTKNLVDL